MAAAEIPRDTGEEGLLLVLPHAAGARWQWRRVQDGELGSWHEHLPGDDAPWRDIAEDARVVALVPSADCPVRVRARGDMPLAQALAAARLEAGSALNDGAGAHVAAAAAPDQRSLLIATTSTAQMDLWLGELAGGGLLPEALVPAALVLPAEPGGTAAELAGQPIARTPEAAFTGEPELLGALGAGEARSLSADELDEALLAGWRAPPLNLRQGAYGPRRVSFFRLPDWRQVARMAAVALLLGFLVLAIETLKLEADARAREQAALAAAQKRFPAAVDLTSAQALATAELARRGAGGGSFSAPTAAVFAAMRPIPSLRLRDLGYGSDGTLRFQAAAPSADDINRLLLSLQQEGWQVTVPPSLAPDPTGATVAAITVRAP